MRRLYALFVFLFVCFAVGYAQTTPIAGSGAPAGACALANYGQPYTDTTNIQFYTCTPSGWVMTAVADVLATFGTVTTPVIFQDAAHFNAGSVFPEEWGAVGNGTTDDSAAVNACIAYSGTYHVKCIAIPQTAYLIQHSSIKLTNTSWFQGASGASENYATRIDCEISPCVTVADTGALDSIHLSDLTFVLDPTISGSVGLALNSDLSTSTFIEWSYFGHLQINNAAGPAIEIYGTGSSGATPFQFNDLEDITIQGPNQIHNSAPLIDMQGYLGQSIFKNIWVNGPTANPGYYTALWTLTNAGNVNSSTLLFLNDTIQDGEAGLSITNCSGCAILGINFENVEYPVTVAQSRYMDISDINIQQSAGFGAWGPIITDSGYNTGSVKNVIQGSTTTPSALITCNQSSNTSAWTFNGGFATSSWFPNTSDCITTSYLAATTVSLFTPVSNIAGDNGATPIQTINSYAPPGIRLTLCASSAGWVALETGGNIVLGTQPSPYLIPASSCVTVQVFDSGGNYKYHLLDSNPQGGTIQGDTDAGDGVFATFVSGTVRGCLGTRSWNGTGTIGTTSALYNWTAMCPNASGNTPTIYTAGPSALNASLSWTLQGSISTTALQKSMLTSAYTNSTHSATTIMSFPVAASTSYVLHCEGLWMAAASGYFGFGITGPSSPTLVTYSFVKTNTITSGAPSELEYDSTGSSYPTGIGEAAVGTASTDMRWALDTGFTNGSTAGTLALTGVSASSDTLTIEAGSYCTIQ